MDTSYGNISKCLDEITNLLFKINNPIHLSNVHSWVIKLTTGELNNCKADYLRLLEYMLKSEEGVRYPFVFSPPDGPLIKLNGLARPLQSTSAGNLNYGRTRSLAAGGGSACFDNNEETPTCAKSTTSQGNDHTEGQPIACSELIDFLDQINGETVSLQKFLADVQRFTCDGGLLMAKVTDELLSEFQTTVELAFEDRTQNLSDALAKEQVALLLRYRTNGQRMLSRAQILQDHLRELMPNFQYERYVISPEEHIKFAVAQRKTNIAIMCPNKDNEDSGPPRFEEESTALQQKKMMCALNWLRSEVERADCENMVLGQRYDTVVAAIAAASKKKLADDCRAKTLKRNAKIELEELRKQSAKQVTLIDSYVEKISIEDRTSSKKSSLC